jgi:iron complex outermembrane receptor protein
LEGSLGYVDIKYKEFMSGQSTTPGNPPVNISEVVTPGTPRR